MNIGLIVALTNDYIIGRLNVIPWVLPLDMLWFKYHTLNKIVIMGRKTFESIGNKPLSNRFNIVLSRSVVQKEICSNLIFVQTPEEALWVSNKMCFYGSLLPEVMVIGGAQIYDIFLSYVNRLYMTRININLYGDILFPSYREKEWSVAFYRSYEILGKIGYSYSFIIFERVFKILL